MEFVIEEKEEKVRVEEKRERRIEDGDGEEGKGKGKDGKGKGRGFETGLPFSPSDLTGFLTRNHQLTQGRTQYPEPRPKNT